MNVLTQYWRRLAYKVSDADIQAIEKEGTWPIGAQAFMAGHNWLKIPAITSSHVNLQFPGIYLFSNEKEILYIGSSTNVGQRLSQHRFFIKSRLHSKTLHDLIVYIRKDKRKNEHLTLEMNLIQRLKPRYNRRAG